jgi:hypothetical protein
MVNTSGGSRSWLCLGLQGASLAVAVWLGFLVAARPQQAAADGLLPTTVPVTLPVTVPVALPTTTTTTPPPAATTTTPAPATDPTPAAGPPSPTPAAPAAATAGATAAGVGRAATLSAAAVAERAIAGAMRLSDGSTSIPVTSVRGAKELRLVVTLAPPVLKATRPLTASIRLRDARGYLVRGATVTVRSIPRGTLGSVARARTTTDGRVAFVVRAPQTFRARGGRLWLLVTAADPTRVKTVSISQAVAVPVTARQR